MPAFRAKHPDGVKYDSTEQFGPEPTVKGLAEVEIMTEIKNVPIDKNRNIDYDQKNIKF